MALSISDSDCLPYKNRCKIYLFDEEYHDNPDGLKESRSSKYYFPNIFRTEKNTLTNSEKLLINDKLA